MAANRILCVLFCLFFFSNLQGLNAESQTPDPTIEAMASALNLTYPSVYMAESEITVDDENLDYISIHIIQSESVDFTTTVYLDIDNIGSGRYAHIWDSSLSIQAGQTNATAHVYVDYDSVFRAEGSMYNISLTSCNYCELEDPKYTILTVEDTRSVNVSFAYDSYYGYEGDCTDPCYRSVEIRTSLRTSESVMLPLKIASNSSATYLLDYYFETDPPAINLSSYENYHYLKVYIKQDEIVEKTEYFYLSFDEDNFPENFQVVGDKDIAEFRIHDDDYMQLTVEGDNERYSEDIGTVTITITTNLLQDTDMPINVTLSPSYGNIEATPGEDFVPFDGIYYIPAGMNSTVITVTILDDDIAENEETVNFRMVVYAEQLDEYFHEYGYIYIEDDETKDNPLLFSFDFTTALVNESSGTLDFYIRANIKNDAAVYLEYLSSKDNGLTEYNDYIAYFNDTIKRNVFHFDKATEHLIQVTIINDCDIEATEEMTLNISEVSVGSPDVDFYQVKLVVEDNDVEGDLNCMACSCGSGDVMLPTDEPTIDPGQWGPPTFYFELDEFDIYEGECSYYDIFVISTKPTNATVFIGIQPWELTYEDDFTISKKKLVFYNNDRQNFSFRALQDMEEEPVESTLVTIAYVSEGNIGQWNAILVNVLDGNITVSEVNSRSERSIHENGQEESPFKDLGHTAITTGLVAGLVSSLLVVMVTTILFGLAVLMRKSKNESRT